MIEDFFQPLMFCKWNLTLSRVKSVKDLTGTEQVSAKEHCFSKEIQAARPLMCTVQLVKNWLGLAASLNISIFRPVSLMLE